MKQKYIILVCVCGLAGCNKLVTVPSPRTSITTNAAFSNPSDANAAVAGLYSLMMTNTGQEVFSNGSLTLYAAIAADEAFPYSGASDPLYNIYTDKPTLVVNEPDITTRIWNPAYQVIYNANRILEGLAASTSSLVTDSIRGELGGEAKFVRALCYFYLTNCYGDVPMPLITDFNVTEHLSRSTQAVVYTQIIQDLKDAQVQLASGNLAGAPQKVRASTWAATALLARVYLYRQEWDSAEAQATALIESGQFSLCSSPSDVFLANSSEAILQLEQDDLNNYAPNGGTFDAQNFTIYNTWAAKDTATQDELLSNPDDYINNFQSAYGGRYIPSPELMAAFEPGDLRKSQWMQTIPTPSAAPFNGAPFYNFYKYTVYQSPSGGVVSQYYMVLRLGEQYLIRAEARAQQGANLAGAASDLNMIRSRAGLPNTAATTAAALLDAVAHERQTELFAEWGHRWFDLKRTGKAGAVLGAIAAKQPWSDDYLLFPISVNDRIDDPHVTQNPGYH